MSVLVGKKAPSFSATAVINGKDLDRNFNIEKYKGEKYVLLFFYTKDFSGICPSELHDFQDKLEEFKSKNVEVIGCSTDSEESHLAWLNLSKENGGIDGITYPLIADTTKTISSNYGTLAGEYELDEDGQLISTGPMIPFRGLFLIDKQGIIQHLIINHFTLVRNVAEVLRVVDALHYFEEKGEFCPVN
tara:strand:- start:645 stop:1211 length:567 start_codon:yes stop_codon:yes gene_type:complete